MFDPCIWKKDGIYYSLSGWDRYRRSTNGKRVAADFVFRSKDLETWEYLHPLTEDDRFTLVGDDGACPYFWPIGDRHMLLFFSHTSGGQYLLGDYDDGARQAGRHVPRPLQLRAVHTVGGSRSFRNTRRTGRDHRDLQHEPGLSPQRAGTRS